MSVGDATERKEVEINALDQRFSSLRLHCPREFSRLRAHILRTGLCDPVLVSTQVEPGRLVLIDGFKRAKIIAEKGATRITATLLMLEEKAAKASILLCNQAHRGMSELEQAWIVHSLCRTQKLPQLEVAELLKHHKSWVSRRLALVERLDEELQEQVRLGLLLATVARELSRFLRGNQVLLANTIQRHGLSSRQAVLLVTLLLEIDDPQARQTVLSDPLGFLESMGPSKGSVTRDPRLGPSGNELRRNLLLGQQAMLRLWQSIKRMAPCGFAPKETAIMGPLWEETERVCQKTEQTLLQLGRDSGLVPKTEDPR